MSSEARSDLESQRRTAAIAAAMNDQPTTIYGPGLSSDHMIQRASRERFDHTKILNERVHRQSIVFSDTTSILSENESTVSLAYLGAESLASLAPWFTDDLLSKLSKIANELKDLSVKLFDLSHALNDGDLDPSRAHMIFIRTKATFWHMAKVLSHKSPLQDVISKMLDDVNRVDLANVQSAQIVAIAKSLDLLSKELA